MVILDNSNVKKTDFICDIQHFFNHAKRTLRNIQPSFSINKYKNFLTEAKEIVGECRVDSKNHIDTLLDDAKQSFSKTAGMSEQPFQTQMNLIEKSHSFFECVKKIIEEKKVQIPKKKFLIFCCNASPLLLHQYQKWLDYIKEQDIDGFKKINLLKIFGISGKEEPHSKFLVWLMKEEESHDLGDAFLKKFMDLVSTKFECKMNVSTEGAIVIPEASGKQGTPDIKIRGKDYLCIVENKIRSMEGKDQTKRYAEDALEEVESLEISKEKLFLIFLSPTGRTPFDHRFKSMNYDEIINLLKEILEFRNDINDSTRFLINQFILNLEMEILHRYDFEKSIKKCLDQCSKYGDQYLWNNYEDIFIIYNDCLEREG